MSGEVLQHMSSIISLGAVARHVQWVVPTLRDVFAKLPRRPAALAAGECLSPALDSVAGAWFPHMRGSLLAHCFVPSCSVMEVVGTTSGGTSTDSGQALRRSLSQIHDT